MFIALKDLKRNALLSKDLGKSEPTYAGSDDEDVHFLAEERLGRPLSRTAGG